jgi:hypothetical protein
VNTNKRGKKQSSNRQQASQQQLKKGEDQVKRGKSNEIKQESKQKTNAMRDQKVKRTWMRRRTRRPGNRGG